MSEPADRAPNLAEIEALAERALATIPNRLRRHVTNLLIRVDEFPDDDVMAEMELENPYDLLGLYQGVSMDRKSVLDAAAGPDMVFLYRGPLLHYWCDSGESLRHLVRHVLIHEIGHHFGFSDADMTALEQTGAQNGAQTGTQNGDSV